MSNTKKFLQVSVLFIAFLALVFVSALVTMKAATWGKNVIVPDVSGKELAAAINTLKHDGLEIKVAREEYHPSAPEGSVISQLPLPGTTVKKGRNVSVVVSLGSQEVTVPDFQGQSFRMVLIMLKQVGMTLGEVGRVASDAARDTVIAQDPLAQTVEQKGGKVNLLVSDGAQGGTFITPELVGKTVKEAEDIMKPMSVGVSATGKGEAIASQDPRAGYPVSSGRSVTVVLGARPALPKAAPKPGEPAGPVPIKPPAKPSEKPAGQTLPPAPHAGPKPAGTGQGGAIKPPM